MIGRRSWTLGYLLAPLTDIGKQKLPLDPTAFAGAPMLARAWSLAEFNQWCGPQHPGGSGDAQCKKKNRETNRQATVRGLLHGAPTVLGAMMYAER
jgi:hypothetical protein